MFTFNDKNQDNIVALDVHATIFDSLVVPDTIVDYYKKDI